MRAAILSGSGRYADPWHRHATTSRLIAETLVEVGFDVTIRIDIDAAMAQLDDIALLVVNAGDPWRGEHSAASPPPESIAGLDRAISGGVGILGLHAAVASLRDYPSWAPTIGRMWVPGSSWHPPADVTHVRIRRDTAPELSDVCDFDVYDESYLRLQAIGDATTVAEVEHDGRSHPVAWIRTVGSSHIACDVLGHDERSFREPGHRRLIQALARWAASAE